VIALFTCVVDDADEDDAATAVLRDDEALEYRIR